MQIPHTTSIDAAYSVLPTASWGVGGRRFKSSRADQINILDVSDTYGSPTETRILSEFAGFLLSVSFGIDRLQPDVLAIPLVI